MPPNGEVSKYIGVAIAKGPKVMVKIGWRFLKVKRKARKAETLFKRRLIDGGMDPGSAAHLAEAYGSTVSIRQLLQTMGIPGKALENDKP